LLLFRLIPNRAIRASEPLMELEALMLVGRNRLETTCPQATRT
jgi:hypothetical protein